MAMSSSLWSELDRQYCFARFSSRDQNRSNHKISDLDKKLQPNRILHPAMYSRNDERNVLKCFPCRFLVISLWSALWTPGALGVLHRNTGISQKEQEHKINLCFVVKMILDCESHSQAGSTSVHWDFHS